MDNQKLLRINHLTSIIGVSRPTIYRWIKRGILPKPIRIGKTPYWSADRINQWLSCMDEKKQSSVEVCND